MMTLTHIASASYLALVTTGVGVGNPNYVMLSLGASGILDLDHLYYLIKDHKFYSKNGLTGNLHHARSYFHELIGFAVTGIIVLIVNFLDSQAAMIIGIAVFVHLLEDILLGISSPFIPINRTTIHFLPQRKHFKVIVDLILITVFTFLWLKYLNGF